MSAATKRLWERNQREAYLLGKDWVAAIDDLEDQSENLRRAIQRAVVDGAYEEAAEMRKRRRSLALRIGWAKKRREQQLATLPGYVPVPIEPRRVWGIRQEYLKVGLSAQQYGWLRREAESAECSMGAVVRRLIDQALGGRS